MIRISTESGLRHSIEIGPHLLHTDVPESSAAAPPAPSRTTCSTPHWAPARP